MRDGTDGYRYMRFRALILMLLCILAQGCGYQLRGTMDLPKEMNKIHIDGASGPLSGELRDAMKRSGGSLAPSPEAADLVLRIVDEEVERRIISLSPTGKGNEFEYVYRVDYELGMPKEGKVLSPRFIEINRDFFNDQVDAIAKSNEEDVLRTEIYRQAAETILRQASAALKHSRVEAN